MPNDDSNQQAQRPKEGLYLVSAEEIKLIRRLRELRAGAHLVIIQADGNGLFSLTLLNSGKIERLRRHAEQV